MAPEFYVFTILAPLVTILLVFGMRYFALIQQARARAEAGETDRQLAEKTAATLTAIETRLAAIEKVLKDVG